jgi:hypothetical protein
MEIEGESYLCNSNNGPMCKCTIDNIIFLQDWWAIKIVICEFINLPVIILNILLVDWYLGHQFYLYGVHSIQVYIPLSFKN